MPTASGYGQNNYVTTINWGAAKPSSNTTPTIPNNSIRNVTNFNSAKNDKNIKTLNNKKAKEFTFEYLNDTYESTLIPLWENKKNDVKNTNAIASKGQIHHFQTKTNNKPRQKNTQINNKIISPRRDLNENFKNYNKTNSLPKNNKNNNKLQSPKTALELKLLNKDEIVAPLNPDLVNNSKDIFYQNFNNETENIYYYEKDDVSEDEPQIQNKQNTLPALKTKNSSKRYLRDRGNTSRGSEGSIIIFTETSSISDNEIDRKNLQKNKKTPRKTSPPQRRTSPPRKRTSPPRKTSPSQRRTSPLPRTPSPKTEIIKKKRNKNKGRPRSSSYESSEYSIDDDTLRIDQKGDLNYFIQPRKQPKQKKPETKKNSNEEEQQLKDLINKIMKNKNDKTNKGGKIKRIIKTEESGAGDKGYTIYLDKSGTGGGLGENTLKKNMTSYQTEYFDGNENDFNNNNNNNSYPNGNNDSRYNNNNSIRNIQNQKSFNQNGGPPFDGNLSNNQNYQIDSQNQFINGNKQDSSIRGPTKTSIEKRDQPTQTLTEQQTQTDESKSSTTLHTQTDDNKIVVFPNNGNLIANPNQLPSNLSLSNNRPLYRLVMPPVQNYNNPQLRQQLSYDNLARQLVPMLSDQKSSNIRLVVKSPRTKYVTADQLKIIKSRTNTLSRIPSITKDNIQTANSSTKSKKPNYESDSNSLESVSLISENIFPLKNIEKKYRYLENIRRPVKFINNN
jgi:hypothetical protein